MLGGDLQKTQAEEGRSQKSEGRGQRRAHVIPSEARNLALAFLRRSARRRARFLALGILNALHAVSSTEDRLPLLTPNLRADTLACLGGIIRNLHGKVIESVQRAVHLGENTVACQHRD